jgi:hypothetical protein
MDTRNSLLGLAGVVALTATAAGKPPDLPAEPHVEGREASPVAREFYEPIAPPTRGLLPTHPLPKWATDPAPLADLVAGIRDTVLNRLTVPLGMVPVRD